MSDMLETEKGTDLVREVRGVEEKEGHRGEVGDQAPSTLTYIQKELLNYIAPARYATGSFDGS